MSDDRPHKRVRNHYHVHPNFGHSHPHHHLTPHHGPAFGRKHVTEVEPTSEQIASVLLEDVPEPHPTDWTKSCRVCGWEGEVDEKHFHGVYAERNEPDLRFLLRKSIEQVEARKRDEDGD